MGTVFLLPSFLYEGATESLSPSVLSALQQCQVFFAEEERSARRFFKRIWKEMIIDDYTWYTADKKSIQSPAILQAFRQQLEAGKNIGIVSEAGCPGVADPGQVLVALAHTLGATVKPLSGPSSILLALMASGLNGQHFCFNGYLPIDTGHRIKHLRELEAESTRKQATQIFMETPYRNNAMLESILKACQPTTRLCIAANLTAPDEFISTRNLKDWKTNLPDLHKKPTIFLLQAY